MPRPVASRIGHSRVTLGRIDPSSHSAGTRCSRDRFHVVELLLLFPATATAGCENRVGERQVANSRSLVADRTSTVSQDVVRIGGVDFAIVPGRGPTISTISNRFIRDFGPVLYRRTRVKLSVTLRYSRSPPRFRSSNDVEIQEGIPILPRKRSQPSLVTLERSSSTRVALRGPARLEARTGADGPPLVTRVGSHSRSSLVSRRSSTMAL